MTTIFLAGAENAGHQKLLREMGANRVAVNVASLLRRPATWELDLPGLTWEWMAYADAPVDKDDFEMVLNMASKPPVAVVGPHTLITCDGFLPIWNGEMDMPEGNDGGMVITDRVFKDKTLIRRALSTRKAHTTLGVLTGSIDPSIGKFDFVVSPGWWSTLKFGETQVWDGHKMWRHNADAKEEARIRHRDDIIALGLDPDLVLADDPDEVAKVAIASWMAYSAHLDRSNVVVPIRTMSGPLPEVSNGSESMEPISGSRDDALATHPSGGRQRTPIPVMGMSTIQSTMVQGDGSEIVEDQVILIPVSDSVRQCDNCHLGQAGCPGFSPGASCAYSIPVEIRSKDQLQAMMSAMVELQTQRVLQARFAEEVQGQELTAEVGREMDRLFYVVQKSKEIMDNRDVLKLTMEAKAGTGVLSRLFGEKVGANARMLERPVMSEDISDAIIED